MQTIKELLSEIEELRSLLATPEKKQRAVGKPRTTVPKTPEAAAAGSATEPAPAANTPDAPVAAVASGATIAAAPSSAESPTAQKSPVGPSAGKTGAKARSEAAARDAARTKLKDIASGTTWFSARYAATSAMDGAVADSDLDKWLGELRQKITHPATVDEALDDARELVRAVRCKVAWKDEKSMPEERKAHLRKTEQLLIDLMEGEHGHHTHKVASVLHDAGTRHE
ncbi:MAG: hypothetical protein WCL44_12075, partial [bacterium]